MSSLAQFVATTIKVLGADGIDGYLPTLVDHEQRSILVLEGVPDDVDHRTAVQNWIKRNGPPVSYEFGVQSGLNEITAAARPTYATS